MMKRVAKPEKETSRSSFKPQHQSRFAPRPFPARQPEHESPAGCCEPLFSYNLLEIPAYPRETVQPKLRLGPVGDRYEQEADRMAGQVMSTISSPEQNSVQRQEDEEDLEEEEVVTAQRQMDGAISSSDQGSVQRQEDKEDEKEDELQRKVDGIGSTGDADVGPDLESSIQRARGSGQPLSDGVRQPMEKAFGTNFGGVRLHTDGQADRVNRSIQARAFTTGQDVFFRQGEYRPGSSEGQRLLAHELTHVVQQNGKAVQRAQMQATGRVLQAKEDAPPNRTGMPDHLKSGLENISGMDLSGVRVHYSSSKPAQLNALAYTQGHEIHVAPGQEKHLPHEAWHAVQQMQGRVKPTMQMKDGVPVNDDEGLEREADMMGAKALGSAMQCQGPEEEELLRGKFVPQHTTDASTRAASRQTSPPALVESESAEAKLETQREALNQSTRVQAIAQFQRSLNLSPLVAQLTSLNGVPVNETIRYQNTNQDAILTHMRGEWDNVNGHAVTGGHLLNEMIATWGNAVANSSPDNVNVNTQRGVHFGKALPGDNITPHQHEFRLVHDINGQGRLSSQKSSTFWPRSWRNADLIRTLNNSFRNGTGNQWASKENTTYWYRWQTLGPNTAFPIEKVPTATGTHRNKMKAGRL